ncbi:MAG: hypothetical protein HC769_15150 [Cyanobacteria bacterium CRU_2_1]|nr:hypothetical protein [Cyanobacteria bacterium RU_5_0]NJR60054.1 hypothetical protein [Cyanobacteria bacterium CRU_2_1]
MSKVQDDVLHKTFKYSGTVIGHGKRMVNGKSLPTLKVRLVSSVMDGQGIVMEDLASRWVRSNIEDGFKLS